jgi:intein/homing endonuclease
MSDGVYSPAKAAAFPERIAALARGEQINPVHLHLILSDLCSLDCPKCFPPGTLILTEDGYEPIERIEEGTRVWSHDGKLHTVTKTMPRQHEGELIKIRPYKLGSAIRATLEHPFLAFVDNATSPTWRNASDLRVGDRLAIRVPDVPLVSEIRLSELLDDLSGSRTA